MNVLTYLIVPHLFEEGYYYYPSFTNNKNFKKLGPFWMWALKLIDNCIFLTNEVLDKWTNKLLEEWQAKTHIQEHRYSNDCFPLEGTIFSSGVSSDQKILNTPLMELSRKFVA